MGKQQEAARGLKALGFTLGTEEPQSAIIAVIMPDLERGAAMWEALLHEGLYVKPRPPPATPANMTLLRCSLCAEHRSEQVDEILGMFEAAGGRPAHQAELSGVSRGNRAVTLAS